MRINCLLVCVLVLSSLAGFAAEDDALSLFREGQRLYLKEDTVHNYYANEKWHYIENFDSIKQEAELRSKCALDLLKRSAQLGCDSAQFLLGLIYSDNHAYKGAFKMMLAAAQKGHVQAQYAVGMHYAGGIGTNISDEHAFEWLVKAAQAGNGDAMYQLGVSYMDAGMLTEAQLFLGSAMKSNNVANGYRYDMYQRLMRLNDGDKSLCNALQSLAGQYISERDKPWIDAPHRGFVQDIRVDPVTHQPISLSKVKPNLLAQAKFPGGDEALVRTVNALTRYPDEARANGVKGQTIVRFDVDEQGYVDNASVMLSSHPLLDAEAVRVAKALPRFEPQTIDGQPVRSVGFYTFDFDSKP